MMIEIIMIMMITMIIRFAIIMMIAMISRFFLADGWMRVAQDDSAGAPSVPWLTIAQPSVVIVKLFECLYLNSRVSV